MNISTRKVTVVSMLLAAMAALVMGLMAPVAPAQAATDPSHPAYAYQLKVTPKPAVRKVVGSAESTNQYNTLTLQYRAGKTGKWANVASRKGDHTKPVVKVIKKNARKGFYRTRITVQGMDCSSEPCTTKNFYYYSGAKYMK